MTDPLKCGGLMPTPARFNGTEMFVCSSCGRTCGSRKAFFEMCPVLRASELEFQGKDE